MTKMLTLVRLAALMLLTFGLLPVSAQVLMTETFSDQTSATANWKHDGTNGGVVTWAWTDVKDAGGFNPGAFTAPSAGDGYFWFDSDANGDFAHDVTLTGTGKPIDCTGKTDVRLYFYTYFRTFSGADVARVGVSTDGVNFTYKNVKQFDDLIAEPVTGPAQLYQGVVEIPLPEAANQPQVWIQFRWEGQFEYYWKVDDIQVTNGPRPVNVTFRVNMSKQASVDPGGVRIAGTFTNWADEVMTDAGNGLWTITKALPVGDKVQYKFKNGANGWEKGQKECGVDDNNGGYNRELTVADAVELTAVCFDACTPCVVGCKQNPDAVICDDFETYNIATVSPQATWWKPWDAPDNNAVLSSDVTTEQASNGTKSMKVRFQQSGAVQGDDQLLLLGNKATGHYSLKWKMYVPAGKNAYYNLQNTEAPTGAQASDNWTMDIHFNPNGNDSLTNPGPTVVGSHPIGQWFTVEHEFDLDHDLATLSINGQVRRKWAYTKNIGSVDFYATDANSLFYIDEVEYVKLPDVVFNVDVCEQAIDLTSYLGAAPGVARTTPLLNNNTATVSPTDPVVTCWNEDVSGTTDKLNTTMWFSFTGDGKEYKIQTVPCTATNYIGSAQDDEGDTQIVLYSGQNCGDLTPVTCNDDLNTNGEPDWRAGIEVATENGKQYYMMVDAFEFQGIVAKGEFCVEVQQKAAITCADAKVGTFDIANQGFVCNGDNVNDYLTRVDSSFVIADLGPVFGFVWCITDEPVPANAWPGTIPNIASTSFAPTVGGLNLPNDGTGFPPGVYYLTPVVMAGGELIDPAVAARIFNINEASIDCYFVGASKPLVLLPTLDPVEATAAVSTVVNAPGLNGAIDLTITGGLGGLVQDPSLYAVSWSNGANTQDLTGLAAGTYTATIEDPSGCTDPFELTVVVSASVDTKDPASVKSLTVAPNPTSSLVQLNLALTEAQDVRVEVLNALGQTMQTYDAGKVNLLNKSIDLHQYAAGTYFLRITMGGETASRRITLQK